MITPPYSRSHSQTRSTNASRPRSKRVVPSFRSSFSTTAWVAIPAWSYPGCQSALKPRMRCQRMRTSWIEPFSAWPMCSAPVTFGGGTTITYGGLGDAGSAS
jgi:hypothetical protein